MEAVETQPDVGTFRHHDQQPHTETSVLFTGKHRSKCECASVCALNNQACCGYTQHTGETMLTRGELRLWPHLATNGRRW